MSNTSLNLRRTFVYATLVAIAVMYLTPLVWMIATSGKTASEASNGGISLLPHSSRESEKASEEAKAQAKPEPPASNAVSNLSQNLRDNYSDVWNDPSVTFPIYLRNTLIIASLSVVGMTLSSAVVAYGFSRIQWRGRTTMFAIVLATMMIPFPVIMAPLYVVFRELGWIGSLKPLWVPAWFGGAFNIFLLRQFYMGLPKDLDEAATIDGCTHWGIFWRIILPLSKPALAVVALFHFIFVWNDFLGPLIFLTHRDQFTLALGLQLYQSKAGNTPWNLLMAASTLVVAPVLILFFLAQKTLVKGIATEGVKG